MSIQKPPAPQSPSPIMPSSEELARLESGKRAVNIMLLGMGVAMLAAVAYGLYRMTSVILANL